MDNQFGKLLQFNFFNETKRGQFDDDKKKVFMHYHAHTPPCVNKNH